MRMETTAISMGYTARANMTPIMYHITPLVVFWGATRQDVRQRGRRGAKKTHLFAFAHEKADSLFKQSFKLCRAEPEDVARDDDREASREGDDYRPR